MSNRLRHLVGAVVLVAMLVPASRASHAASAAPWPNPVGADGSMRQTLASGPSGEPAVAWSVGPDAVTPDFNLWGFRPPVLDGSGHLLVPVLDQRGESSEETLAAVNTNDGSLAWTFDEPGWEVPNRTPVVTPNGRIWLLVRRESGYGTPGVDYPDEHRYEYQGASSLLALDPTTGSVVDVIDPSPDRLFPTTTLQSDPVTVLDDGDLLLRGLRTESSTGTTRTTLARFDPIAKTVEWEATLGTQGGASATRVVTAGGYSHVLETVTGWSNSATFLFTIDLASGDSFFHAFDQSVDQPSQRDLVALPDGGVIVDAQRAWERYDVSGSDLSRTWQRAITTTYNEYPTLTLVDDVAVYGSPLASRLQGISITDGSILWEWTNDEAYAGTVSTPWLMPADADGLVYAMSVRGNNDNSTYHRLLAFDAATGDQVLNSPDLGVTFDRLGPIDADGTMYVGTVSTPDTFVLAALRGPSWDGATPPSDDTDPPADEPSDGCGLESESGAGRLGSDDAIATAVAISQCRFDEQNTAWHAVLARDDVFADALAGAPLTTHAPMLYTPSDQLDDRTAAEIDRILPDGGTVYVLGGQAAVSESVASALRQRGHTVTRLSGQDRIATSMAIADQVVSMFGQRPTAILARAFGTPDNPTAAWADSVSVGAFAADQLAPVLVTNTGNLDGRVADWLGTNQPDFLWLVGGEAALSSAVESQARGQIDGGVLRAAGPDRAATAVAIAERIWAGFYANAHVVVSGWDTGGWASGFAAAGYAADHDATILLTHADHVPQPTAEYLPSCDSPPALALIGGQRQITDATAQEVVDTAQQPRTGC